MADRPKLWHRVCTACGTLDGSYALIAGEEEAEGRLAAEPWACSTCGIEDCLAARSMEDGDLDEMVGMRDDDCDERTPASALGT